MLRSNRKVSWYWGLALSSNDEIVATLCHISWSMLMPQHANSNIHRHLFNWSTAASSLPSTAFRLHWGRCQDSRPINGELSTTNLPLRLLHSLLNEPQCIGDKSSSPTVLATVPSGGERLLREGGSSSWSIEQGVYEMFELACWGHQHRSAWYGHKVSNNSSFDDNASPQYHDTFLLGP